MLKWTGINKLVNGSNKEWSKILSVHTLTTTLLSCTKCNEVVHRSDIMDSLDYIAVWSSGKKEKLSLLHYWNILSWFDNAIRIV